MCIYILNELFSPDTVIKHTIVGHLLYRNRLDRNNWVNSHQQKSAAGETKQKNKREGVRAPYSVSDVISFHPP